MSAKSIMNVVKTEWLSNGVLNTLPLRSTRINTGEEKPYGLMKVKDMGDTVDSGRSTIKKYKLTIEVWSGSYLANLDLIRRALENALSWRYDIAVPDGDWLLCKPISDDDDLDDKDTYGNDDRILRSVWTVVLNEDKIR